MKIIKYRKIFYALSITLLCISVFSLSKFGLKLGVDFRGGTVIEAVWQGELPSGESIAQVFDDLGIENATVRQTGVDGFIIRTRELKEPERIAVVGALQGVEIKRLDTVGPILGAELRKKAVYSIVFVLIAIILFITFAFRHVSKPVSSWKYGIVAIVALLHDVIIPTGVFSVLGHIKGVEVDSLFVTALLVVLGFSIHDTIVVFDRTRENLKVNQEKRENKSFDVVVGESINQTFTRSINTSLTTILSLIVLYFVGPEATQNFVLALLIGIVVGTYSSIFIGSPLLVTWEKWQKKSVDNK